MYIVESLYGFTPHIPPHISHPPLRGAPGHGRTQRRHQDTTEGAARGPRGRRRGAGASSSLPRDS